MSVEMTRKRESLVTAPGQQRSFFGRKSLSPYRSQTGGWMCMIPVGSIGSRLPGIPIPGGDGAGLLTEV